MMPRMDQVDLKIEEMHCAACSTTVEKALLGVEGVDNASVAVATGRGTVKGANLDGASLASVATAAGYPTTVIDSGIDPSKMVTEIEQRQQKNTAAWRFSCVL